MQKDYARSERDNDLIYHDDIPAVSALPVIPHSAIAKLTVVPGLLNPESVIGPEGPIFAEMIGWGAQEAISKLLASFARRWSISRNMQISTMTASKTSSRRR